MSIFQLLSRRTRTVLATLFLLVIATVGCSGGSNSTASEQSPEIVGDYLTCKGFVDAPNIEAVTGESGLQARERLIAVTGVPGLVDSGAVNNCLVEVFETVDSNDVPFPGSSMTLSIVKFQNNEAAMTLFDSTLASVLLSVEQIGDLAEVKQEVIGANSYMLDISVGGIGAIVVFVSEGVFVSMSSTSDADGSALLNGAQLVTAAEGVQSRLPGFAQSWFTDQ